MHKRRMRYIRSYLSSEKKFLEHSRLHAYAAIDSLVGRLGPRTHHLTLRMLHRRYRVCIVLLNVNYDWWPPRDRILSSDDAAQSQCDKRHVLDICLYFFDFIVLVVGVFML